MTLIHHGYGYKGISGHYKNVNLHYSIDGSPTKTTQMVFREGSERDHRGEWVGIIPQPELAGHVSLSYDFSMEFDGRHDIREGATARIVSAE